VIIADFIITKIRKSARGTRHTTLDKNSRSEIRNPKSEIRNPLTAKDAKESKELTQRKSGEADYKSSFWEDQRLEITKWMQKRSRMVLSAI
jgi:hypothetical protein